MRLILLLVVLFLAEVLSAQLVITHGAQLSISGNTQITLDNCNFINNGNFIPGNGKISFIGNSSSTISGNGPVQFYEIEINKTNNSILSLQQMISISNRITFSSGNIDLNGFNIDLGNTGLLNGEKESSRIVGINGGQVLLNTVLTPVPANPGALGATITSSTPLGSVIIRRGHQSQVNAYGMGTTVLRYYDIIPTNNTGLNATLRLNYFDGELNGLAENTLVQWKSDDNVHWTSQGFTSRDATNNFVEKTGITSFSRWTLSSLNNPLPVQFILFNSRCDGNKIILSWKTAQEINTDHFGVERSNDGTRWSEIGIVAAAGNSTVERSYTFPDNTPVQNSLYRVVEHDANGYVRYTSVLRSPCSAKDVFAVWPNPARDLVYINIVTDDASAAAIHIYDNKGMLVKMQHTKMLPGSNQFSINIGGLANGVYQVSVEWSGGNMRKTVQVVKY